MTGEEIAVATHEHLVQAAKAQPALGLFERYLTVWVALCIVAGIALGHWFPAPFQAIGRAGGGPGQPAGGGADLADDHPDAAEDRLCGALHQVREHWRGIGVTLFINWAVKPFSMALLGWLFIGWLFRP